MVMTASPPRPGIIGLGYIGGGVAVSLSEADSNPRCSIYAKMPRVRTVACQLS